MHCLKCDGVTRVIDSRYLHNKVRRRRKCLKCGTRFTTYELSKKQLDLISKPSNYDDIIHSLEVKLNELRGLTE